LIIFRADASPQIGTGHIMRCLSLAQLWRSGGGHSVFITCTNTPYIKTRLQSEGIATIELSANIGSIEDVNQTVALAKELGATWVALDGYNFRPDYQKTIKDSGLKLLFIDDNGYSSNYYADLIVNQNIHASEKLYLNRQPYSRLLLGTDFVLLREEFSRWQDWKREIPQTAQNLLVTLGGTDSENVTLKIIEGIQEAKLSELNVIIVAPNNQYFEQLESFVKTGKNMVLKRNVSRMSELMAWADMVVSAGGTSTWELAFMGVPMIMTAIADNQCQIVEKLSKEGIALNLGWHKDVTREVISKTVSQLAKDVSLRLKMSKCAQALVDGKGADRVLGEIKKCS
jgi:UDP-2,4-diacetamido-2,4,6-trideoxy-beta-L-altropyranose hydrolase